MSAGFIVGVLSAALVDQLVDAGVRTIEAPVDNFGGVIRLVPSTNDGVAFGLMQGSGPWPAILSIGVMATIAKYAHRHHADRLTAAGLGLLLGGALANLTERVMHGAVLDYVDLGLGELRWPTFNVGDVTISVAILTLVAASLSRDRPKASSSE